ncbi:hypothetical protein L2E82_04016 [Cichorium intybus]|uniref:Uncharacterized protein n=1 Tax=Cichorium intybus TaxID=13427 RepID=A0ACB9H5Z2_CICIN|nr:hypothetical protein L2E82_04016 [Cichorium intybus]
MKLVSIDTDDEEEELHDDDEVKTNQHEEDSELEDGEIRPEEDNINSNEDQEGDDMTLEPMVESPAKENKSPTAEEFNDQPVNAVGDDTIIIEDGATSDSQTNPSELDKNNKCGNNGQSIHKERVGDKSDTGSDPIGVGPNNMGLPALCFGPFPSRFSSITMVDSPCLEDMFNVVNDGRLKRRRLLEDNTNLFFPNPFEHNTQSTPRTTVRFRNPPSPHPNRRTFCISTRCRTKWRTLWRF